MTINELPLIERMAKLTRIPNSMTIVGNFIPQSYIDDFHLEYISENDSILIRLKYPGTDEQVYVYPFGAHPTSMLPYVPKGALVRFFRIEQSEPFETINRLRDFDDYVYQYQDLVTLTGKKYAHMRNHINRFKAENLEYSFELLTPLNARDALAINRLQKPESKDAEREVRAVTSILENYQRYHHYLGNILYVKKAPVAFTIAEPINEMFYVLAEKRLDVSDGISDYLRWRFLDTHKGLGYPYCNRLEDSGDLGIRTSKLRMNPIFMVEKYEGRKK